MNGLATAMYLTLIIGLALGGDPVNIREDQPQAQTLIDAMLRNSIADVPQPSQVIDSVLRFQTEVVRVAVPAAQSLGISFRDDGARSLLTYLGAAPIASMLKDPESGAPPVGERAANQRRFVGLLLAHAERQKLQITSDSVKQTESAIAALRPAGWFCPCWPFCK